MRNLGILLVGLLWLWGAMELNIHMVDHADEVVPPKVTKENCTTDSQCEQAWGVLYRDE